MVQTIPDTDSICDSCACGCNSHLLPADASPHFQLLSTLCPVMVLPDLHARAGSNGPTNCRRRCHAAARRDQWDSSQSGRLCKPSADHGPAQDQDKAGIQLFDGSGNHCSTTNAQSAKPSSRDWEGLQAGHHPRHASKKWPLPIESWSGKLEVNRRKKDCPWTLEEVPELLCQQALKPGPPHP